MPLWCPPRRGSLTDPQQFGDELGKGAVGRVVRAIDTQTGKVVAIKQVQKNLLKTEQLPAIQVTNLHI